MHAQPTEFAGGGEAREMSGRMIECRHPCSDFLSSSHEGKKYFQENSSLAANSSSRRTVRSQLADSTRPRTGSYSSSLALVLAAPTSLTPETITLELPDKQWKPITYPHGLTKQEYNQLKLNLLSFRK